MAIVRKLEKQEERDSFWKAVDREELRLVLRGQIGTENRGGMLSYERKKKLAEARGLRWTQYGLTACFTDNAVLSGCPGKDETEVKK